MTKYGEIRRSGCAQSTELWRPATFDASSTGSLNNDSTEEVISTLTIINLLDEVDWVVGGHGKPTPQFVYSLNTLVESYVLTDRIYLPLSDLVHIRYSQGFFKTSRPLFETLYKDGMIWGIEDKDKARNPDEKLRLIYISEVDKGLESDEELDKWMDKYISEVDQSNVSELMPTYETGEMPKTVPLLERWHSRDGKKLYLFIRYRDTEALVRYILGKSRDSRFHPALPVYATPLQTEFFPCRPASIDLYKALADLYQVKVEDILAHRGYAALPVPPLTSILLARSKNVDDLPDQLRRLRSEFVDLREVCRLHEQRLERSSTIGEQFDAIDEFNEFWDTFARKTKFKSSRIIYRLWDIFKEPNPWKWYTKTVDELVKLDQEQRIINRFKGLLDIWNLMRHTPSVQNQLKNIERIFGHAIDQESWNRYVRFTLEVEKGIFPTGRKIV